jgi:molybdopterin synthase catalytic subunit
MTRAVRGSERRDGAEGLFEGRRLDGMGESRYYDSAMLLRIRYFAVVRERLGRDEDTLEVPAGTSAAGALDALVTRHPALAPLRAYLQVAVNQSMASAGQVLADGDELALIPPVAGGSDGHARHARLVGGVPSLDACLAAVRGPDAGGIATFTGMVRARSQGRDVTRLEYEAYAAMAEKVFRELCDEIEAEWPGVRVALEHAVGTLGVGDVAVVIAAAAPHRAEAFRACEAMIDRLKQRAPIWKKETGPDGTEWVGMGP